MVLWKSKPEPIMTVVQARYQRTRQRREQQRHLSRSQRLERRRRRAQAHSEVLEHSFLELMDKTELEPSVRDKLGRQAKLFGQLFAMMFSSAFAGGSYRQLVQRLGINKNLPGRILRALPRKSWQDRFRKMGRSILAELLCGVPQMSEASRSRSQVTLVVDSTLMRKFSDKMRLVARGYSGQTDSVVLGVDVVLLVAVIGDGTFIVPLDFAIRRPDPAGAGRPCHDKLILTETMVERSVNWLLEQELVTGPPLLVGDSWFGSSALAKALEELCGAALLVNGKAAWVFYLDGGRRLEGKELFEEPSLQRRQSPQAPGMSYARVLANSPSFGRVVLSIVWPYDEQDPYYLLCRDTMMSSPRLLRAWQRRSWIEWCFRALKHLLEAGAGAVHSEGAYYGHLALRLMALTILLYSVQRRLHRAPTMEQVLWGIREHWQSLDSKFLNLKALSSTPS